MKIYTSYFGNMAALKRCGIHPISIARWSPRNWDGDRLIWLAPTPYMVKEASREEYIRLYQDICHRVNIEGLIRTLSTMGKGSDVALLCYERPGDFCHRHMLAEYMTEHGITVKEFSEYEYQQEQAKVRASSTPTPTQEPPQPEQLSLFD